MYAIIQSGGQQFRVRQGQRLQVDRLDAEVGGEVVFDRVLAVGEGADLQVGAPTVEGARVVARVISHDQGDKVITFKYRPRKRMRRRRGFRASLTTLEITAVEAGQA